MFTKLLLSGDDLFIVTKLPPKGIRPEGVKKYIKKSLEALQLNYVDVYLIHTPFAFNDVEGELFPKKADGSADLDFTTDHVAVWKVKEGLREENNASVYFNFVGNGKTCRPRSGKINRNF